jgi:hypothetical protein
VAKFCSECGNSLSASSSSHPHSRKSAAPAPKAKVKRGPSAYNKKYARAYKVLKKKHPRTSFAALAKKAHRVARGKK